MSYSNHLTGVIASGALATGARSTLKAALRRIRLMRSAASERRALKRLTPEALADIGIDRNAADAEASRPFWDAPDHWRRR